MAEELRGGVCGGSWPWSRNLFVSSPCSLASNPDHGRFVEANARSSDDWVGSGSDGGRPPDDWSHGLLGDGGSYSDILREAEDLNSEMDTCRVDSFPAECLQSCTDPELSAGFPSLLQTLFDTDTDQLGKPNLLDSAANEFLPSFLGDPPMFGKQEVPYHDWSTTTTTTTAALSDLILSTQPRFLPSSSNIIRQHNLGSRESSSATKKSSNDQPIVKRSRIETPSPLPTFKVRKEKLGDRITAIQQLVSPFGKTDTASVLHEAIEYIKFLHDQVTVLCTPYLKKGSVDQFLEPHQKISSLRNGGLCLVPISSTFAVADTTADFWTPTFGGSFK